MSWGRYRRKSATTASIEPVTSIANGENAWTPLVTGTKSDSGTHTGNTTIFRKPKKLSIPRLLRQASKPDEWYLLHHSSKARSDIELVIGGTKMTIYPPRARPGKRRPLPQRSLPDWAICQEIPEDISCEAILPQKKTHCEFSQNETRFSLGPPRTGSEEVRWDYLLLTERQSSFSENASIAQHWLNPFFPFLVDFIHDWLNNHFHCKVSTVFTAPHIFCLWGLYFSAVFIVSRLQK